jgi:hypothetical protein
VRTLTLHALDSSRVPVLLSAILLIEGECGELNTFVLAATNGVIIVIAPYTHEGRYPGRSRVGLPMESRTLNVEVLARARLPSRY